VQGSFFRQPIRWPARHAIDSLLSLKSAQRQPLADISRSSVNSDRQSALPQSGEITNIVADRPLQALALGKGGGGGGGGVCRGWGGWCVRGRCFGGLGGGVGVFSGCWGGGWGGFLFVWGLFVGFFFWGWLLGFFFGGVCVFLCGWFCFFFLVGFGVVCVFCGMFVWGGGGGGWCLVLCFFLVFLCLWWLVFCVFFWGGGGGVCVFFCIFVFFFLLVFWCFFFFGLFFLVLCFLCFIFCKKEKNGKREREAETKKRGHKKGRADESRESKEPAKKKKNKEEKEMRERGVVCFVFVFVICGRSGPPRFPTELIAPTPTSGCYAFPFDAGSRVVSSSCSSVVLRPLIGWAPVPVAILRNATLRALLVGGGFSENLVRPGQSVEHPAAHGPWLRRLGRV